MGTFEPSGELKALLAQLPAKQANAVAAMAIRLEVEGDSIEKLLRGRRKVCAYTTYYRKGGWHSDTAFQMALARARSEVRDYKLSISLDEAMDFLRETTPAAALDLKRQVTGDVQGIEALGAILLNEKRGSDERIQAATMLGRIGTPRASALLIEALDRKSLKEEQMALIEALGMAGAGTDMQRRQADVAVLDRASPTTAGKGSLGVQITSDDMARARANATVWERERFGEPEG